MKTQKITEAQRTVLIEILVAEDIRAIQKDMVFDDFVFISTVLNGDGWKPYNQLSDEEIITKFLEREFYGFCFRSESFSSRGVKEISDELIIGVIKKAVDNGELPYDIEFDGLLCNE